ncbi:extracellular solute-binding protein [Arthrobacter sp. S2(2024)]|uniref:extracellular solute-binding protein n=1 Tax=Arthrobacter sp. S2(2024) TaxID=3111911 RepID=UPI002FCAEFB0
MAKHMSRLTPLAAFGLATTMALSACSGSAPTPAASRDLGTPVAGKIKPGSLKGTTLTFASSGGIFQDGQMKSVWNPFAEESGATMQQDAFDPAKTKAMVESGQVSWDIVDAASIQGTMECGTTYQKLDKTQIDFSKIPKGLLADDCSVPSILYGDILVYNTALFGANPPTSFADFFDTKKYPGKRGVNMTTHVEPEILEIALQADGVDPSKLAPADINQAVNKYKSLGNNLVGWTSGAQAQQQLESGEVAMSIVWSGRGFGAAKAGAPVAPMWNQWKIMTDSLLVPTGVKDPQAAFAGLNYFLGSEQQAKSTEATSYAPVNIDAKPNVPEQTAKWLVTSKLDSGTPRNAKFWRENFDALTKAWGDWVTGN